MPEIELPDSGSGIDGLADRRQGKIRHAGRALAGILVCTVFLAGWARLSATEPDAGDSEEVSAAFFHEPLSGQTCIECHEQTIPAIGRCLLTGETMCVLCHDIPAVGGQSVLVEPSAPICFQCHSEDAFKGDFVHGPFAAGACLTCHSPHGENDSAMVRIAGRQMCLPCHEEMGASLANARFRHEATATGCTECHTPHASDQRYQLRKPVPDACAGCHEDIFKKAETAVVTHSPVGEDPACLNCHNSHKAENDYLLTKEDMDVCLDCHNEPIEADQEELAPMGRCWRRNRYTTARSSSGYVPSAIIRMVRPFSGY